MSNKKILIPSKNAESWKELLADPEKHWKDGYSAKLTAYSWEKKDDIPKEIIRTLKTKVEFTGLELLIAIPEYKVSLPGGSRPSQNDVLAVFTTERGLSVMTVEGKVKENFDEIISNWEKHTSDVGIDERLGFILSKIGIIGKDIDNLRYQLFHRLASAVIIAEKFHAKNAIMIIQSFEKDDNENHFSDFSDFLKLYNHESIDKFQLYKLTHINGIDVFAGWVYSGN